MAGVVLDLDGVLLLDGRPLPGAAAAVEALRSAGHGVCVLTNTTSASRASLAAVLAAAGFELPESAIVTASWATGEYLRRHFAGARALVLAERAAEAELWGIEQVADERADVVVLGGPDERWDWPRLELALRALLAGAVLVAMQENRWWQTEAGPRLDAGAAVRGLAYAASLRPRVIGKPSPRIFRTACLRVGQPAASCVMVGDDLRSDVLAARRAGMRGVLVRTGKGERSASEPRADEADAVLASVADVAAWIEREVER